MRRKRKSHVYEGRVILRMGSGIRKKIQDKYQYWDYIREILEKNNFIVGPWKEINYGIQFEIEKEGSKGLLRIYDGKKGLRLDSSQIKDEIFRGLVEELIYGKNCSEEEPIKDIGAGKTEDPEELIGIDESGKGDYFGPLVIAGVFVNSNISSKLKELGVADSKKLSDIKIRSIAQEIKKICPHSIVIIGNQRYNELYNKIGNLNKLLAWGHARVLENLLSRVNCSYALSDQFGQPELIKNALMTKGKRIDLRQRPRAEENIAVAAASVLARYQFIVKIDEMEAAYGIQFPKGTSARVFEAGKKFIEMYGKQELNKVAKLHFKTTESLQY